MHVLSSSITINLGKWRLHLFCPSLTGGRAHLYRLLFRSSTSSLGSIIPGKTFRLQGPSPYVGYQADPVDGGDTVLNHKSNTPMPLNIRTTLVLQNTHIDQYYSTFSVYMYTIYKHTRHTNIIRKDNIDKLETTFYIPDT